MSWATATRGLADLHRHWRPALAVHAFARLLSVAVGGVLLTAAFRAVLTASGDRVISNFDIAAFLLSPTGVLVAITALTLVIALLLVELAGLTQLATDAVAGRKPRFTSALAFLVLQRRALLVLGARIGLRLVILALPVAIAAGAAAHAWLGEHDINFYLAEKPPEWFRAVGVTGIAAAVSAIAIAWQLSRWLHALPVLVQDPAATAAEALAASERETCGRLGAILGPLFAWWLGVAVLAALGISFGAQVSATSFNWAGMNVRRVVPVAALCLATAFVFEFFITGLALAGQQFQLTRGRAGTQQPQLSARAGTSEAEPGILRTAVRAIGVAVVVAIVAAMASWLAVRQADLRPRVEVTAHRGASIGRPENSLAAFRAAIDAGTDWIELDVQRLGDGQVVVVHDGDFLRVAGDPRKVGAVVAGDLTSIRLGHRFADAFADEHPPLLTEVIAMARGHARLNVELKYNVPDPALAHAVVALLRQEDFIGQSVVTSLNYSALRQVERLDPRMVTGHIVTAAMGNVVRTEADFLSLNAAHATAALVRRAHRAGKRVHVWTVNTRDAMLELSARGVDNVITDDPALFARVEATTGALDPHELLALRLRALFGRPPAELADPARVAPL